jgi:pimeloyl-ACP methyl ester carboxylesterase
MIRKQKRGSPKGEPGRSPREKPLPTAPSRSDCYKEVMKGSNQMSNLAQPIRQTITRPAPAWSARTIGGTLLRFALGLIAATLAIPVALLPFITAVPAPIWLLLVAIDVALVVGSFRLAPPGFAWPVALLGVAVVAVLAVSASQRFAGTPPILGADGRPLPGSIATLEPVELNGSWQWISIRGTSADRPVLLFLAGGPGGTQLAATRNRLRALEDYFVVVNWEQPGAGKSYAAVPRAAITPERYISDGIALTNYLRQRFDQAQIYVVGESWGSALGVWMAQREPQLFHAIVGAGQMVDFAQTDIDCYDTALRIARERGDTAKVAQLEAQGPPPYPSDSLMASEANYLLYLSAAMSANPAIGGPGYDTFGDIGGPEYGLIDKVNYIRGTLDTFTSVWPQLWGTDLRASAARLEVPVYILEGRHDINASPYLAEEYYNLLDAPHKALIWFERSGHSLWIDEHERFVDVMVNQVLADTQPAR